MSSLNWAELIEDAGDIGGDEFAVLPAGEYDLKVAGVDVKVTAREKTMFTVKAEVQTGPSAKRLIWDNLVISPESPKAMGFFFRKMSALGLPQEYFRTAPSNESIAQAMIGRTFRGRVSVGSYNNKPTNNIEAYAPASGAATGPSFSSAPPVPQAAPVAASAPVAAPAPPVAAPAPQAAPPAPTADVWSTPAAAPAVPAPAPAAPSAAPAVDPWSNTAAPQAAPPLPF